MHDGQGFVLAIVGMVILGGVLRQSMRNPEAMMERHRRFQRAMGWGRWNNAWSGWGGPDNRDDLDRDRAVRLLTDENEKLHGKVMRLEERIAVLERIATDPAERTARAIDALREH